MSEIVPVPIVEVTVENQKVPLLCGQKLSSSRIEVSHPMASKETVTVVPWALRPNKERDIIEPTPRPNIQTKDFGAKSSHLRG